LHLVFDDFVGKPIFSAKRLYLEMPPGVVTGLAWTSKSRSFLFIEDTLSRPLSRLNSRQ